MTDDVLKRLAAPFPASLVEWRVGATNKEKTRGLALAYIDARTVQDRLDEVCGIWWQVRHHHAGGEKLACDIGIKVGDEWLWRGDGAGATDVEADKGSFSDSFKRAAVRWGVARYLYDLDSPWVDLEARGNSHVIPDRERSRLRSLLRHPEAQATPAAKGYTEYDPREKPPETSQRPADTPFAAHTAIPDAALPPTQNGPAQPRAAQGTAHPRFAEAIIAKDRIKAAVAIAALPKTIDDLFMLNKADLALIEEVSPSLYDQLISYGGSKKIDLIAGTP